MTRILSYNILIGGTHRVNQLIEIIKSTSPDIIGLVEAIDEHVVKEIAEHLGMQYRLSGRGHDAQGWQAAILSRFPIMHVNTYANQILIKQPLLEVSVQEPDGQYLTVFVTHLTADFGKGKAALFARRREIQEILRIMSAKQETRHILMGDFNSLAPNEHMKGSSFLRYVLEPNLYYQLKPDESIQPPDLNFVLPPSLHFLKPLLMLIPRSKLLSRLLDGIDVFYAPYGGIDLLNDAGYIDCFRFIHPHEKGFTWPAPMPAGRVDFIFACPELAQWLLVSDVVIESENISGGAASDHLAVFAEFKDDAKLQQSEKLVIQAPS